MRTALLVITLLLSGCEAIGNWADDTGRNLPVVDERCDYWQCMTEHGKERDAQKKAALTKAAKKDAEKPAAK